MHVPSLLIRGCGFVVLLMAALWAGPVAAATCTSTSDGNWNVTTTWDCGIVPDGDDDAVIAHNVTLTGVTSVRNLTINTGATLTGSNALRTLSVFGDWVNNGVFVPNQQIVSLTASGSAATPAQQSITGNTTFSRLRINGGFSIKGFGNNTFTVTTLLANDAGTMDGGTSTFVFEESTSIEGARPKYFHNLVIDGSNVLHKVGTINISGDLTVNSGGSLGFSGTDPKSFHFNGTSLQTFSIASGGLAAFVDLVIESTATVDLPNLDSAHLTASSFINHGVLRQSGSTAVSTQFAYIRNSDSEVLYQGLDLVPTSGTLNATVAIAGNRTNCLNPVGYDHRNRCFGVKNNDTTATTANVTLYTTADEDDIPDDRFYEYSGSATWTDRGACPAGDGDACTANGIVIEPGDNYFLIGTNTPPTPVTLTTFTVTRSEDANHLAWETATEVNFAGFYVQRRAADGDFARVGDFLYAQGSPLSGASYTWTDTDLANGPYHYRLEAVDFDQSIEFFEPTSVEETRPNAGFSVYLPFSFK